MFKNLIKKKLAKIQKKAEDNIKAVIVADSLHPQDPSCRLTTFKLTYPRFIHSEVMTHRAFSRNASSSRAIPVKKSLKEVWNNPALPVYWGKNQPGMQAKVEVSDFVKLVDYYLNLLGSRLAVIVAWLLMKTDLHKQITNRRVETDTYIDVILTGTDFDNFYFLRDHEDAQPELKYLTGKMLLAHNNSVPKVLNHGEWSTPFVHKNDDKCSINWLNDKISGFTLWTELDLVKFSVARCARVSYRNHDQSYPDPMKDIGLHNKLEESNHWSPFEHQAQPADPTKYYGNLRGFRPYRMNFPNQNVTNYPKLKKY